MKKNKIFLFIFNIMRVIKCWTMARMEMNYVGLAF